MATGMTSTQQALIARNWRSSSVLGCSRSRSAPTLTASSSASRSSAASAHQGLLE